MAVRVSNDQRDKNQQFQWDLKKASRPERTLVVVPNSRDQHRARANKSAIHDIDHQQSVGNDNNKRDEPATDDINTDDEHVEEAVGLALAISLEVIDAISVLLKKPNPATLLGKGKVAEISREIELKDIGLVIVDHPLSPVQQRNLEEVWQAKVLDRTGLILEIFGDRARTKEGRLQVELAHLNYQKGRLVRSWTHLERQRGGFGFVGGPGETQIEADRRIIRGRIKALEKDLEKVRRTRNLHRAKRKKVPHPVVALVGYTNAGKSTLFNRITGANVHVQDQLFATLDPTLRKMTLPNATPAILSDTVGFISNLPTDLIAAFRATLEEVVEADLIIHVRDMSNPMNASHRDDVYAVLDQIGVEQRDNSRVLEVWNKMDLVTVETESMGKTNGGNSDHIAVSAHTGFGVDQLLLEIESRISGRERVVSIRLNAENMASIGWVYDTGVVVSSEAMENGELVLNARIPTKMLDTLYSKVGRDAVVLE